MLARAFEDVERAVVEVPASAFAVPRADDLDAVASVAILRRAVVPFERALVSLISTGLVSEPDLPGVAGLLYADPADADPEAVRRALKGVPPGVPDLAVWTASATLAPAARPFGAQGVPAAILAATPGVVLRQAVTVEEFEARLRRALSLPSAPIALAGDETSAGLVL